MISKLFIQMEDFLSYCHAKGLSQKTIFSYDQTLKLFCKYLEEECGIKDASLVKEQHIRDYILYLQERGKYTVVVKEESKRLNNPQGRPDVNKPVSKTTINNYIRNIKVFFNYLDEYDMLRKNPVTKIKQLKNPRKAKDFITDREFNNLIKCLDLSKYSEYRDFIIIQLIIDTGMRIGECLLLTMEDVDVNERCIMLKADNTKGKKDRVVFFSAEMNIALRRWIQFKDRYVESEYLFPSKTYKTKIRVSNFEANFRNYCARVDIKDVSPHTLRNSFAKRFLMAGGDIYTLSRILGHSSVTVTEKAYLDLTDKDLKANYQSFSPLAKMRNR